MSEAEFSGFRAMWLFAMFDLPVDTREAKRAYVQFRKVLLGRAFTMLQFSVYARYCPSAEEADSQRNSLRPDLPPNGQIRFITLTDKQFARMDVFIGKKRSKSEEPPPQLSLF